MPQFRDQRILPYTAEQVFDLVADIGKYPEFLPWCVGARIVKREGNVVTADLDIGFKLIQETFTSRVTLDRPGHIHVDYVAGPMRTMTNDWTFQELPDGRCSVGITNQFEFKSRSFQLLAGALFAEIARHMVGAFEQRARRVLTPLRPAKA
jgi:coenzyme Q-binding protein COQ10